MQLHSDNLTVLCPAGRAVDWAAMRQQSPEVPFGEVGIAFLAALSTELMRNPLTRTMPDVATFAFFCRKANILKLKEQYASNEAMRLGRGVLFHVAPSNVPVNFAYSLAAGVLSGNANIVRVPSKEFAQVSVVVEAINAVLSRDELAHYADRLTLVRYERGGAATDFFSSLCDVRIIWGGDATIAHIRQSPIPARSFDVTFADRYSISVIDAQNYLTTADAAKEAENFYNDTYLFDQNACSAPHLVVWRGAVDAVQQAKAKFWNALYDYTARKYELTEVLAVDKLTAFYSQAVAMPIRKEPTADNLIWRVEAESLPDNIDEFRCKAGYFTEHRVEELAQIAHIINRKYQTIAHYGLNREALADFVASVRPLGVDRIVPLGATTQFALVWDGYDLIRTLSRVVSMI